MSNRNKHSSISMQYMNEVLEYTKKCPRASCKGYLVEIYVRYGDHGTLCKEYECLACSKVVKPFKYDNRDNNYRKNNYKKSYSDQRNRHHETNRRNTRSR